MFKIKTNNLDFKKEIESKYLIYSHDEYKYLITDSAEFIEEDKINLVFSINQINEMANILQSIINGEEISLNLKSKEGIKKVKVTDIDYFEALENDVYAISGKNRYLCDEKLYNLEEFLKDHYFVRTSKSYLVNILKINIIRPMLNYKFMLIMVNGDKIDVNRTYVKQFKQKLDL